MYSRLLGVCTLAALCAAVVTAGAPAAKTKLFDMRVAIPQSASNGLPFYWALDHGYFKALGLNIHPVMLAAQGPVAVAAVLSHSVEIAPTDTLDLYTADEAGQNLQFIASQTRDPLEKQSLVSQVFVKPGSGIASWADLQGKTIAEASLHSDGELVIRAEVDAAGGDSSSVHFVAIPAASQIAAAQAGRVDAITVQTPFSTQAVADGFQTLGDPYADYAPGLSHSIDFGQASWLNAHPKQVIAFVKAFNKGVRYCEANEESCRQYVLPKYFRIAPDKVDSVNLVQWTTSLEPVADADVAKLAYKYHYLGKPVDMSKVFWKKPAYLANL